MKKHLLTLFGTFITAAFPCSAATVIESWQFNETAGTQFTGLTNSAGSGAWSGNDIDVSTNGSGQLAFTVGTEADPDNLFRNSTLTASDVGTGVYELEWLYTSASIAGGDATGANMGFGIRDLGTNADLFVVRIQRQNSELRLQHRVGSTNTDLEDFNATSLSDLLVRVAFDLDNDTFDVFWKLGANPEQSSTGIAMSAAGLEMDSIRMFANTNTTDWGASDSVSVDYLTLSQVPEPSAAILGGLGFLALLRRRR